MGAQGPLDLRPHQRPQPSQVDLSWPIDRSRLRAPVPEPSAVVVADLHGKTALLVTDRPGLRQPRPARPALAPVPVLVPRTQPQRRVSQVRADRGPAGAVAVERLLLAEPPAEAIVITGGAATAVPPTAEMPPAQARGHVHRRQLRADPAGDLLSPLEPLQPAGGRHEISLPGAAGARSAPVLPVLLTQVRAARARPCAISDHASPPVDRMVPGDADHLSAVERVERRAADQRGKQLQPVPAGPVAARFRQHGQRQGPVRHRCSPHTVRNAAPKAGSPRSTCA